MTVNQFIKVLQKIKPELRDKDIMIWGLNGIEYAPGVHFKLKDRMDAFNKSAENVDYILLV
jgi:hypothetical protein